MHDEGEASNLGAGNSLHWLHDSTTCGLDSMSKNLIMLNHHSR